MARVFFVYSHQDESFRDQLEAHLAPLRREGVIETWHDRKIGPGRHVDRTISAHLEDADIILLLVSSDFMASDYCVEIEMRRALEKHAAGEAAVIPVIVRPCDWHGTPFGRLNAVPRDGKPVSTGADRDAAFLEVARAVREIATRGAPTSPAPPRTQPPDRRPAPVAEDEAGVTRRVRIKKEFTDHDRDQFVDDAFEHMVAYFERALREIATQDAEVKTRFRRTGDDFAAAIYVRGTVKGECKVWRERGHIAFSWSANSHGGLNEQLSVADNGYDLVLRPLGMATFGRDLGEMTKEQAAEYYWGLLVRRLES